jgi:hypothetical protein
MTFVELMALDTKTTSPIPSPIKPASQQEIQSESKPASSQSAMVDGMAATSHKTKRARKRATKTAANHAAMTSCHHDTTTARQEARAESSLVSQLREAVKPLGKEGATHRFTPAEKASLAEIVYQYHQRGLKTSENEIVRVAVNWLLQDHAASGEQGMLRRVLRALHE